MRDPKISKLPLWMTKNIPLGEEINEFIAMAVGFGLLFGLFVAFYFFKSPFGSDYRPLEYIAVATIAFILILIAYWFFTQLVNLQSCRKEAIICRDNAGNKEDARREAVTRLEQLGIREEKRNAA